MSERRRSWWIFRVALQVGTTLPDRIRDDGYWCSAIDAFKVETSVSDFAHICHAAMKTWMRIVLGFRVPHLRYGTLR